MKRFILCCIILYTSKAYNQALYFPPLTGSAWDTLSPTTLNWCPENIDSLYTFLESKNTKSFIILKDGKIVLEKYFGTFTKDSSWYWASAGKSLTSTLVGIAQDEKYLSLSDTSAKYLGSKWTKCSTADENKITIRHHITMTTGLDDGVPNNHCTADTCLKCIAAAGSRWAYHNAPYTLLDKVLETATGSPLNIYHNQKIKTKTGMTGLYIQSGDDNVYYSTTRSMARFGLLILNKGNWNGTTVLGDTNYYNQMTNTSQTLNLSYGYLWWLNGKTSCMVPTSQIVFPTMISPNAPADMFAALGKNGQLIDIVPSKKLVFIRMGNAPDGGDVPFTLNDSIWIKINKLSCKTSAISHTGPHRISISTIDKKHYKIESDEPTKELALFNTQGKKISVTCQDNIWDASELTSGFYILHITTQQSTLTKKIYIEQ